VAQEVQEGREEVEDDHRNERPSTSRTEENVQHAAIAILLLE